MLTAADALSHLRQLVSLWPEVDERESHGSPTFWGGKKTFCIFHASTDKYGGRAIWIKTTTSAQQDLVENDPERFFVPPYVGVRGWVAVRVGEGIDWALIEELLEDAYRSVAPKRAIKALELMRSGVSDPSADADPKRKKSPPR